MTARVHNASALTCTAPPVSSAHTVHLRVTLNGVDFYPSSSLDDGSNAGLTFTYTSTASITGLEPWHGFKTGGTPLGIVGAAFPDLPVTCFFSGVASFGRRVSSSLVTCPTPSMALSNEATVSLTFGEGSGAVVVRSSLSFRFEEEFEVTGMTPLTVSYSAEGHNSVTISGFGFKDYSQLACEIGGVESKATWISPITVECAVPSTLTPGVWSASVTPNGVDFKEIGSLVVVSQLVLSSIQPTSGPTAG